MSTPMVVIADRDFVHLPSVDSPGRYDFVHASSCGEVLAALQGASGASLLLIGSGFTDGDPLTLLRSVNVKGRASGKVVFAAENPTVDLVVRAFKAGACDFITKPVPGRRVMSVVSELMGGRERMPTYWARRLDRYLVDNLSDPDLSLESLKERFAVSKSYLSKLFRSEIGTPFRIRLMRHRINKATRLLETTNEPIYMVAYCCGFRSHCRLTEAFTRYHGIAPRRYRAAYRSRLVA